MASIRQSLTPLALLLSGVLFWQSVLAEPPNGPPSDARSNEPQDGRHDFDFEVGRWKAHVRTLVHRLSHASDWDEQTGIAVTRTLPMFDGWNESELQVTSTKSGKHVELLAVRVYNASTHQWAIYGTSIKNAKFDPPMIGEFKDHRGEFYSQDTWEGRAVLARFIWTVVDANHDRLEQAFSSDGGKTWETNWIYDGERLPD